MSDEQETALNVEALRAQYAASAFGFREAREDVLVLIAALEEAQRQRDQARDAAVLAFEERAEVERIVTETLAADAPVYAGTAAIFASALNDIRRVLSPDAEGGDQRRLCQEPLCAKPLSSSDEIESGWCLLHLFGGPPGTPNAVSDTETQQ